MSGEMAGRPAALRRILGAEARAEAASAGYVLPTAGVAEEVRPILEILPLPMPAYRVVIARGQGLDTPRAPAEVTATR